MLVGKALLIESPLDILQEVEAFDVGQDHIDQQFCMPLRRASGAWELIRPTMSGSDV